MAEQHHHCDDECSRYEKREHIHIREVVVGHGPKPTEVLVPRQTRDTRAIDSVCLDGYGTPGLGQSSTHCVHEDADFGGGTTVLATNARKAHATPSLTLGARRTVRRSAASLLIVSQRSKDRFDAVTTRRVPRTIFAFLGAKGLRLVLNTATAALVVMLPYTAATSARVESTSAYGASPSHALLTFAVQNDDLARAQTAALNGVSVTRSPMTVAAEDIRPEIVLTIGKEQTLLTMA